MITPLDQAFCPTDNPWLIGERRLEPYEHLPSGGCLAVEMSLSTPAYVFLVGQDAGGELTRMFPSDCPAFREMDVLHRPGSPFRFPPRCDPAARVLELDDSPGVERIYAIAITSPDLADRFAYRLDEFRDLCPPGRRLSNNFFASNIRRPHERVQQWQRDLNRFFAPYPEKVQWREIRFRHDPP